MNRLLVLLLMACSAYAQPQFIFFGAAVNANTAATPTFSPTAGAVGTGTVITISTATSGCSGKIYWNLTGSPTTSDTNSTSVTAGSSSFTIYAKVIGCAGYNDSAIGTSAYTIDNTPQYISAATVQTSSASATSLNLTYAQSNGSGHFLACAINILGFSHTGFSASDTAGNTWTCSASLFKSQGGGAGNALGICYVPSAIAGANTVTLSVIGGTANQIAASCAEFTRVTTLDASGTASGAITSVSTSTSTTTNPDLVLTAAGHNTSYTGHTAGTESTAISLSSGYLVFEYYVANSNGVQTGTYRTTTQTSAMTIGAFK